MIEAAQGLAKGTLAEELLNFITIADVICQVHFVIAFVIIVAIVEFI